MYPATTGSGRSGGQYLPDYRCVNQSSMRLEIPPITIAIIDGRCVDQYVGAVRNRVDDERKTYRIFSGVGRHQFIFTRQ